MTYNNFHLTYDDLTNFTYGELSKLKYCDLMLDKLRLVDEIQKQHIIVPDEIRDKIFDLCDAANVQYSRTNSLNLYETIGLISAIITIIECAKEYLPQLQVILEYLISNIR